MTAKTMNDDGALALILTIFGVDGIYTDNKGECHYTYQYKEGPGLFEQHDPHRVPGSFNPLKVFTKGLA